MSPHNVADGSERVEPVQPVAAAAPSGAGMDSDSGRTKRPTVGVTAAASSGAGMDSR